MSSNARRSKLAFTLRSDDKCQVRYSRRERILFSLLPKVGEYITTTDLYEKFWIEIGDPRPWHWENTARGVLKTLMKKASINERKFEICQSKQRGPEAVRVWVCAPRGGTVIRSR